MMKNNLILSDTETKQLNSGDTMMRMRLLKEQPPDNARPQHVYKDGTISFWYADNRIKTWNIPLQYPVGTRLGVRETWGYEIETIPTKQNYRTEIRVYFYKSEYINSNTIPAYGWYSPAAMPKEAIRDHVIVDSNTVKRVGDVTEAEALQMGFKLEYTVRTYTNPFQPCDYDASNIHKLPAKQIKEQFTAKYQFTNHFNSLYAKPKKWKDGYVSYPYSLSSFSEWALSQPDKCSGRLTLHDYLDKEYWLKKPLTFYPNAYLELFTARKATLNE